MDQSRQEFSTNMQGGPFQSHGPRGWHLEEPDPHTFHIHSRDNVPYFQNPDDAPRMRGAINKPRYPPTPNYFPRNPSYPPGFDNGHMHSSGFDNRRVKPSGFDSNHMSPPGFDSMHMDPPGFDNGHMDPPGYGNSYSVHGEMRFQESLEITSDRPFLPKRRAPPDGSNTTSSSDQIQSGDNQGSRVELCGPSQSPLSSVLTKDSSAQKISEGGSSELLSKGQVRKRKKLNGKNAQPAHADTTVPASSFEEARPPPLRSSILGEPPVPRTDAATTQKSATADTSYERATKISLKLWKDLNIAMQQRERTLKERENSFMESTINKQVVEEEMKQVTAMKSEVLEERRRLEEEAQRIRGEKDAMERTSTDIALQMVELKQVQKQIEKEKAALLALKAELDGKRTCSQERECVTTTVDTPLGAVKAEIAEEPTTNPRNSAKFSSESDATQSNMRNRESTIAVDVPSISYISPVDSNRNLKSVKAEPVNSDWDAAHENESGLHEDSGEDDMDDVPLATRLRAQRVDKTREERKSLEEIRQREDSNVESSKRKAFVQKRESQLLGSKSLSYDIHMKRNKVSIEVALQEDAPGLLEQLEERGLLEDMGIYQDMGVDDSLAKESPASEFGQLEGVIGKLWGPSSGLGKDLVPVRAQGSGNMPTYCLACLLSLIDQTKSLRKRNWPVEWGWCRRLRAFLFVFEKHNRIVLERPEYGYATYFFELVQKLPVKWQVQRLITVMSVASTGRAALVENRQLLVGLDLTDEEAAILEDYGWNRSCGLGSLLNYCNRVVHEYKKGQDPAELGNDWRQKIGKHLMDGYDQGSIVQSIPRKLARVLGNNLKGMSSKAEPT